MGTSDIWLLSYLLLWIVVLLLILAVLVLARQIGLLHRRLAPFGARMTNAGPGIGERAPELRAVDLQGQSVDLTSNWGKQTLLVFVSPTCGACAELAPALRSLWRSERKTMEILLVSIGGDEAANRTFLGKHKLDSIPCVLSLDLSLVYHVLSTPYGVLIDQQGVVRAKGIVNQIEHLESLLIAAQLGHPTLESLREAPQDGQAPAETTIR